MTPRITPRRLANATRLLAVAPLSLLVRLCHPNIWLVTERSNQARDNGYVFYQYLRKQHPDLDAYYVIERDAPDREKLLSYGERRIIDFNSWRHYFFFCASRVQVGAHTGFASPNDNPFIRWMRPLIGYHTVFVPHGVSYGISEFCLAKYGQIDLFICSGMPEYTNVLKNYGYKAEQVAYTGFPRLDIWHSFSVNPKQIVLMPTWRMYLAQDPETVFEQTTYFRAFQDLINNPELSRILEYNDLTMIFYPHHNMRSYIESFHTDFSRIQIAYRDVDCDIQKLLKESALLITDYSSVHFDFAYMGKPVLYYQFDRDEFWSKQYGQTDFDAAKDGFGPVAYDAKGLLKNLRESSERGFKLEGEYLQRMHEFYLLHDQHNCERVYETIVSRGW